MRARLKKGLKRLELYLKILLIVFVFEYGPQLNMGWILGCESYPVSNGTMKVETYDKVD